MRLAVVVGFVACALGLASGCGAILGIGDVPEPADSSADDASGDVATPENYSGDDSPAGDAVGDTAQGDANTLDAADAARDGEDAADAADAGDGASAGDGGEAGVPVCIFDNGASPFGGCDFAP